MASPQLEDGYTRWANELLEQVYRRGEFPARELRVILYVGRYSYGYNRKFMPYSRTAIASELNLRPEHVSRIVADLVRRKVLQFDESAASGTTGVPPVALESAKDGTTPQSSFKSIGIQKDFDIWLPPEKLEPSAVDGTTRVPRTALPSAKDGTHIKTVKTELPNTDPPIVPQGGREGQEQDPKTSEASAHVIERYNAFADHAGAPKCHGLERWPESRRKALRAQLKNKHFDWEQVLRNTWASKFIRESIDRGEAGWFNIDWLLKPKNWGPILEKSKYGIGEYRGKGAAFKREDRQDEPLTDLAT